MIFSSPPPSPLFPFPAQKNELAHRLGGGGGLGHFLVWNSKWVNGKGIGEFVFEIAVHGLCLIV